MSDAIFVIGATGNVGGPLTRQLTKQKGERVRAATRAPEGHDLPGGAEAVRFDMAGPETHAPALGDAERVFMMAPPVMEASSQLIPFLDTAEQAGVRHVVLMTAMGVEHAPDEVPMRAAELHLQKSSMDATILRPNWFTQNFVNYWGGMIQHDGVMRLPAADAKTSFIDTRDIAAVAAAALTEAGHVGHEYTLTGPEALTYHEAAAILSEAAGREIRYEPVSDEEAHRILTEAGLGNDYAEMLIGLFQSVKAGNAAPVTPDVEKATGKPPRSVEAFAREHAEAWQ